MAKKKYSTRFETGEPLAKDDLQLINGIGPAVEKRLNGIGIYTFTQLAALLPADIAAAIADLTALSTERIIKQDWIGQARKLASVDLYASFDPLAADFVEHNDVIVPSVESEQGAVPSKGHHHPATFTVEFLLDEDNNVHSTYVLHIESRRELTWTGWQQAQLEAFLRESAGLHIPLDEQPLLNAEDSIHASEVIAEDNSPPPRPVKPRLTGILQLHNTETIADESTGLGRILTHDEPFDVHLTLDLTKLQVPEHTPLNYKALIYGKGRDSLIVGEAQGTIIPSDRATITVKGNILPEGLYRLAAKVTVGPSNTKLTAKLGNTGMIDGGLVQVY